MFNLFIGTYDPDTKFLQSPTVKVGIDLDTPGLRISLMADINARYDADVPNVYLERQDGRWLVVVNAHKNDQRCGVTLADDGYFLIMDNKDNILQKKQTKCASK